MKLSILLTTSISSTFAAKDILLATFDGTKAFTHEWHAKNDPVMGGKSTSTFQVKNNLGIFDGEVVDVPFLKAPGFITTEARDTKPYPDISSCNALVLSASTSTPSYAGFRLSFGEAHPINGKTFAYGYKANFNATSADVGDIVMPLDTFSDYWDDSTGNAIKTCAEDKQYCPDKITLRDIKTVSIWGEGIAGKVHLEIKSLRATGCSSGPSPPGPAKENIVQLAAADKDLSTLVTAVKAANLTAALSSTGPFTVFAPTNEAFEKLPAAVLKFLLEPVHIRDLQAVLEYHVLNGAIHAADLKLQQVVKTLEGSELLIQKEFHGDVIINRVAKVTAADNIATNGVVHIINEVLIPHQ